MKHLSLWDAPFDQPLKVQNLDALPAEAKMVMEQLGVDQGEVIEKCHVAPLGDPLSILIGSQMFTLRKDICRKIFVEAL